MIESEVILSHTLLSRHYPGLCAAPDRHLEEHPVHLSIPWWHWRTYSELTVVWSVNRRYVDTFVLSRNGTGGFVASLEVIRMLPPEWH